MSNMLRKRNRIL